MLPTTLLALVLLLQPGLERLEVVEHRLRVDVALAADRLERLRPRLARAELEHRLQLRAGRLVPVDGAGVERALIPRGLAERAVELGLQQQREEVAGVWG